jgi:hypothetical protein
MTSSSRDFRTYSLVTLLLLAAVPALAQKIGTTGAVKPEASGTAPGGATKTLNLGGEVVFRERIRTSSGGALQILFTDKSTMNIGPNSDITIDKFIYDPSKKTGELSATLAKGAMRFVGGQISHTAGATINTPVATIGIRGGVAFLTHIQKTQTTEALAAQGRVTFDSKLDSAPPGVLTIGEGASASGAGEIKNFVGTAAMAASFNASLRGGGGTSGSGQASLTQSGTTVTSSTGASQQQGASIADDGFVDHFVQDMEPAAPDPREASTDSPESPGD